MVKISATSVGTLYIVATPIGNREDISLRAITTLKSVDTILAEDTRHSGQLLDSLGINKPLLSLHAHNEATKAEAIIETLQQGKSFALISDAGTPLISDPGFPLVRLARQKQIPVVPIPGPCALITALSAAGVPCDTFTFVGFLPAKQTGRRAKLESLKASEHTIVFYESTHRILDCIDDIIEVYGQNYEMVVAKELTKTFEHFISAAAQEIKNWFLEDKARCKGEFVLVLPKKEEEGDANRKEQEILSLLVKELPLKQAVKIASELTQRNKNELYKLALKLIS
ncbi:16S rRNA (cytidine(1402)-2'-O)-methyltransferase [Legionella micdadei]|uniref:Ribosomal RNA small subunit methyltransferase I n=1 Tax=Legionella micdadei TaxID=451 RepID=A0A098GIU6_LEGMI|nr:16S rRNA (cytidine(1402)-2'-O)-methyltransferase [Legionella micdadei]ARG98779.1 rRNA (cytidine-2'-O-)-methyltransferase [Legionella micdadei]ARH01497.1 rRNA (cytidine-2'-O-)-methyltransferase [Legionella micdadei]KTD29004.1 tetrapyrrole (corrin/porphyrin) methylase [Legionella micdadei]NSL17215.1 16S rRNA (cytidine(1402)-2'-O)-methyltransferase [Legionella micdadei]CEG62388.1 putative methyltransferase [Legionella micdadei]